MPSKHIKKQITDNFSKASNKYNDWALAQEETAADLVSLIDEKAFINVLDVGCGTGFCIEKLENKISFNSLTGLDIAQEMVDYCKNKWNNYTFISQDAEHFNSTDKYDLIISNFTAQWFEDVCAFVKKYLDSCLQQRGVFLLSIPVYGSLHEINDYCLSVNNKDIHLLDFKKAEDIVGFINDLENITLEYKVQDYKQIYSNPLESIKAMKRIGACYQNDSGLSVSEMRRLKSSYKKSDFSVTYKVLLLKIKKG